MSGRRTVDATLRDAARRLEAAGVDAPRIQATALLGHALQIDRAALLASLSDVVGKVGPIRNDEQQLRGV